MPLKTISPCYLVLYCMALAATHGAQAAPPPGQLLSSQCAQCHGTNGNGPGFDEVAGKSASELQKDLLEMKRRPVEGIMDRQARGYTDAQIKLIADYLAAHSGVAAATTDH
ncbi:MAG: c-type cytochrome [Candidatus Accumulibacter phosphatis]|uniref:C-type cytochrome n=1 Tax=Candidatus Accumulibacter cognatus TaxID=2954383 RepID=A0A080MAR1_9PROT|nr:MULTISPECIES: c-type cytochrome [Candidatus Accumulibacter]KFB77535.1 MAG: Flavocytochrome c cytochrome subunit [Candidatus Accumulibacter cognatus]MBO3713374.1 c-type cytochrome [Accumulibacter sp.]MCM8620903.1 c-type cytochrome [Accumulibacter sp.]MCQ1548716.1 c-type cytochrome [Candidatus Accumulibacter phosphatis]QLH48380.1 MAG: c-type cytochrome [Candidatus Accumulibacter cognatus]